MIAYTGCVPDKPRWLTDLPRAIKCLEQLPGSLIDRATLQTLLSIGSRRAQQIMAPLTKHKIGSSNVVDRNELILHLRQRAKGETAQHELRRRQRFSRLLQDLQRQEREQPKVWVEATPAVLSQRVNNLPPGVLLAPGRIVVEGFGTSEEALQKLLALAIAVGHDPTAFEELITPGTNLK